MATGINEHNEARRREMQVERRNYLQKQKLSQLQQEKLQQTELVGSPSGRLSSYEKEVQQHQNVPTHRHDPSSVDRHRREQLLRQQTCEYSAKLPNRYTSENYLSQW